MRIAVIALLATTGCNQIYGLEQTDLWDASVNIDAPFRSIEIYRRSVETDATGAATAPVNSALDDLTAFHTGKLGEATTTASTFDGTTTLAIADAIFQTKWRLVLERTGEPPHEVHFGPFAEGVVLSFPRLSRTQRKPLPMGDSSGVATLPMGYQSTWATAHETHRIYTTGIWTSTDNVVVNPNFQAFFDCPGTSGCNLARSLDGPLAAPEPSRGDRFVAIDLDNFNNIAACRHSVGVAEFTVDLSADSLVRPVPEPTWQLDNNKNVAIAGRTDVTRIGTELLWPDPAVTGYRVGFVPSVEVPAFTHGPGIGLALPSTPMLELVSCQLPNEPTAVVPNNLEDRLPVLAHAEAHVTQTLSGGATLANGLAGTAIVDMGTIYTATIVPDAAFAKNVRVGATSLPLRDIRVSVARADGTALVFERGTEGSADYWDVLLHRIEGANKVPVRRYTIANPTESSISIDLLATTFEATKEYVFEIRSFTGRPGARMNNFEPVEERQSMAVVHSATFVIAE